PQRLERAPAGLRMKAMREEVQAGRGPAAFSFTHLDPDVLQLIEEAIFETERPTTRDFFLAKGIDLRKHPVEVVASEIYLCGGHGQAGLVADARGETHTPGLFAAGDCLANPLGFLPGAMVMAEAAAERIVRKAAGRPRAHDAEKRLSALRRTIARHSRGPKDPTIHDFEYKYRRLVNEYVAPPKTAMKLQRFLDETDRMLKDQEDLPAPDPHAIMKVFEVRAGLFSARMAAHASLFREESR
ncbi:MAG: hypothetical protein GY859_33020, partial [Desulfobacterales bacterium]|nr:hypothetical protein [Desulfobacterales bacterium]